MPISPIRPTDAALRSFVKKHENAPLSYPEIGHSKEKSPPGYDVDLNEIRLGEGPGIFEKAKAALQNWQQFPAGWCFVGPEKPPIETGRTVAMCARVLGTWWANAAKIVFTIDDERQFGFAYGTLAAHIERGEELFLVDWRADGSVWYVVRAFSRPKNWTARLNYPFARSLQSQFVRDSRLAMLAAANGLSAEQVFQKSFSPKIDTGRSPAPIGDELTRSKSTDWVNGWLLMLAGLAAWLGAFLWMPPRFLGGEWGYSIFTFAALVCAPLAFELAENLLGRSPVSLLLRKAQLPAALLLLAVPLVKKVPELAAWLAVPWAGCCFLAAVWGAAFLFFGKKEGSFFQNLPKTTAALGLSFMAVGGAWLLAAAFELAPLAFDPVITFLTAIHFHYAGFFLPLLTGLAAQKMPGRLANFACLGVLLGVPLTAAGITASQFQSGPLLETFAAAWMAAAGLAAAGLQAKLAFSEKTGRGNWLLAASSAALAGGMTLAFLYGIRSFWPVAGLDIPWMRALHGSLNSLGFAALGLAGWAFLNAECKMMNAESSEATD